MPVVAAKVTRSTLRDFHDVRGNRHYEADIRFEYEFRGRKYEARTPALRGPQLLTQWNYVGNLVRKYQEGEMYNARVFADFPEAAFLEIEPVSMVAVIGLPAITVAMATYILGAGWLLAG